LIIQYFNMNKHKNYVSQNLSSEHIILKCYCKIVKCFYWIKNSIFYVIIITVFKFTQRAIENHSACHTWHACHRLPTPALEERNPQLHDCGNMKTRILLPFQKTSLHNVLKSVSKARVTYCTGVRSIVIKACRGRQNTDNRCSNTAVLELCSAQQWCSLVRKHISFVIKSLDKFQIIIIKRFISLPAFVWNRRWVCCQCKSPTVTFSLFSSWMCVCYFEIKFCYSRSVVRCCTKEEHSYSAGLQRKFVSSQNISTDTNKFIAASPEDAVQRIHMTYSRHLHLRKS
jgi:hypothetical protein